ncbi:hypothetical protein ATE84_3882 [Aquimarina sp. MAR_2010_214]|uniref:hypothetical protein n=1 Tax=Aquimarina sp. MAR_2010_214 TaxID=1250026 RepID=UPI000C70D574|nr:hypothetical protein [Aquimarina sp. MAR_2010_214]PKV51784.1 hypothetical protein ATE84_3882 [Aquimarina sp. MAR_2010_214]
MESTLNFLDQIDWKSLWEIIRDIVLPHSGTLILNCILFLFLGFIIAIVYCIVLYRKGIFKRTPKYYNWAVKLYIPLLIIGMLYVFGQWGIIRGVYRIINVERPIVVTNIYKGTLEYFFDNEQEKNKFLISLQLLAMETESSSKDFITLLKSHYEKKETKDQSFIGSVENKLATFFINHYGEEIYTYALYNMITTAAGKGAHVDVSDSFSYEQFKVAIDFLLEVGHQDLEKIILEKLDNWLQDVLSSQYYSIIKSLLILLILIMIIPFIEYFIYKKWIAPKYNTQIS